MPEHRVGGPNSSTVWMVSLLTTYPRGWSLTSFLSEMTSFISEIDFVHLGTILLNKGDIGADIFLFLKIQKKNRKTKKGPI